MKKPVFLLGAYDRFNYGDLLFPIIVERVLKDFDSRVECTPYALIESDLSRFGAKPTRPMRELFESGRTTSESVVLVAGGGVLGASWASMRRNVSQSWLEGLLLAQLILRSGEARFNARYQKKFGSNSAWPWVVSPDDFDVPQKVVYNGVGGSYLGRLPAKEREGITAKLAESTFLSVRDAETKRLLASIDENDRIQLVPDSAVVMSRLFPKEKLREMLSPHVLAWVNRARPYLCFQMAIAHETERFPEIADAIDQIARKHHLDVVLLPIGRAQGHEDHTALRRLNKHLSGAAFQPADDIGIFDIMALIAESALFVGTSLHGAVTAQAFAVPHLGMAGIGKLAFYLDTWEVPSQRAPVEIEDMVQRTAEVLALPADDLEQNRDRLIARAMENFLAIAQALGLKMES